MKILIIEDDVQIANLIKQGLSKESFLIETATDGERGAFMAKTGGYALIILDFSLPTLNGGEVLRAIKEEKPNLPIIMLTVSAELNKKEEAFNLGADDYLTKPFLLEELILRIKALLRRPTKIEKVNFQIGSLRFNPISGICKRGQKAIYLTRREACLLQYLFKNQGEVVTRGEILENVWNYETDPFSNSIETHVASLRKKLKLHKEPEIIHTFPGRGYELALKKLD